jgi:D-glycero-alpha-D-manno-heptose-7-phosphate kinase
MIITRTPFRISFFGGGTDYPAWYQEHGGAVLATTINKYCYITCRHLPPFFEHKHRIVYSAIENVHHHEEIKHPAVRAVFGWAGCEKGLEIHHDGDLPARSGLGSSSSFTVGLIHALAALDGKYVTKEALAHNAIHVEQNVIKENVGSQDQISAAFGGFNRIEFKRNDTFQVDPIILTKDRLHELQSHLMLCFTGFSRIASDIAKSKIDNLKNREVELKLMKEMVNEAIELLTIPTRRSISSGICCIRAGNTNAACPTRFRRLKSILCMTRQCGPARQAAKSWVLAVGVSCCCLSSLNSSRRSLNGLAIWSTSRSNSKTPAAGSSSISPTVCPEVTHEKRRKNFYLWPCRVDRIGNGPTTGA